MRRADVISGGILALFGLIMLVAVIPWQIGDGPEGMMSPSLVPRLMMIVITGLSVLLVLTNLRRQGEKEAPAEPSPISRGELFALAKFLGLFAVALGLYLWISPLAAGLALVGVSQLLLGERSPLLLLLMPAAFLLAIWFLFYKLLGTAIL
ncbi:tripartite tricarboxylate transporter TctB family protein [Jiella pacifica]|uniref:DUF1468 domain-containing protein n=1 Tax=Jiella pacifica TaxID=2696469 RepID=A0A6N9T7Z4_9HYPH|nr:tripartite tricarboxylate transporter TctB family protein [Jiella pacifica]NDW07341.1 hypothetical protein [Jiella pacifica]